jgi:sugar phosphate permease
MPPVTAVLLNSVPSGQAGTASGVFNTSRQVGGALAVAVFGALLAHPGTFMSGLRKTLLIAGGVALAAAVTSRSLDTADNRPSGSQALVMEEVAP